MVSMRGLKLLLISNLILINTDHQGVKGEKIFAPVKPKQEVNS